MAVMTDPNRVLAAGDFIYDGHDGPVGECGAFTKADLRAAVNAVDQWVSDNSGSYNTALPQPFKAEATSAQKARLLMTILRLRYISGA